MFVLKKKQTKKNVFKKMFKGKIFENWGKKVHDLKIL